MIILHPDISLLEAARIARQLDCYLHAQPSGDVVVTPNSLRRPRNVIDLRKHRQASTTWPDLPAGPGAA